MRALPLSSPLHESSPFRTTLSCFNTTPTTEIYTLSLHDALPISSPGGSFAARTAPDPARPLALLLRGRRRCRRHRAGTAGEIEDQQQGPEHRSRRPPHTPPVERQA